MVRVDVIRGRTVVVRVAVVDVITQLQAEVVIAAFVAARQAGLAEVAACRRMIILTGVEVVVAWTFARALVLRKANAVAVGPIWVETSYQACKVSQ
jgi:hypothetical protein